MKVINRINNNVVLVKDGTQKMIVTGKGLGFQVYPGNDVKAQLIEQRFILQETNDDTYYINLLKELPVETLAICEEIIVKASEILGKPISGNLMFALADHLKFTMERMQKQMLIDHPLANEIKQFYPKEMEVGRYALKLIQERMHIQLPDGEAVFLTMHIVNALGGLSEAYDVAQLTDVMAEIVTYIETYFQCTIDQNSTSFSRFITHLRYYLIRQLNFEIEESINDELLEIIQEKYPQAYACAQSIADQMDARYHNTSADSEKLYLTLHINRLLKMK